MLHAVNRRVRGRTLVRGFPVRVVYGATGWRCRAAWCPPCGGRTDGEIGLRDQFRTADARHAGLAPRSRRQACGISSAQADAGHAGSVPRKPTPGLGDQFRAADARPAGSVPRIRRQAVQCDCRRCGDDREPRALSVREDLSRMPVQTFTTTWRVRSYELDSNAHVNNAVYVAYAEEVAAQHAEAIGFGREWTLARGGIWVARRHEITYLRPGRLWRRAAAHDRSGGDAGSTRNAPHGDPPGARRPRAGGYADGMGVAGAATGRPEQNPAEIVAAFTGA